MRALVLAPVFFARAALASCPCYTASSSEGMAANCAVEAAAGTNPAVADWLLIFNLVAGGPSSWGSSGPAVANINRGCGHPMAPTSISPQFACEVMKAVTMQESTWRQFCVPTTPADVVGQSSQTLISFDCGYGIGQITSGMRTTDPTPNYDRARVASDPTYNLATGAQILADKWRITNCVGDNQPTIVEDWYSAIWAYNGLAYTNNPSNPTYASTRGIYNPQVSDSRPYQERVFGWMEHPPSVAYWPVLAPAYPDLTLVGTTGTPSAMPDPTCGSPTSCATTRGTHFSSCFGASGGGTAGTGGGTTASGGGSTGTGGGSAATGGGTAATGGGDASGGGSPAIVTLPQASTDLGAPATVSCGCTHGDGAVVALALLAFRRRKR